MTTGKPTADLALEGLTIVTMNPQREVISSGHIAVTSGAISSVAEGPAPPAASRIDMSGMVAMPGFVNTHAHLVSVLTRGLGNDRFLQGGVPGGREAATAIRERLGDEAAYAGARLALSELMLSGVTTTADSQAVYRGLEGAMDGTLRAISESGVRARFHRASVDKTELVPSHRHDDAATATRELDRLADRWSSPLVTVGAEAMALHRVSRELLEALDAWAGARQAPFAMHIAYNEQSAAFALDEHGAPLLDVLARWGILNERFLGYHPVWLEGSEIAALARTEAGVAACAPANMLIGLEPLPLADLLEAEVRVGLGTDQPNDGHHFFEVMKTTLMQQRMAQRSTEFGSPELMMDLATIGGAAALHLEDEIGSIEPAKRADLVVLDGRRPALQPLSARLSNVVYAATSADVHTVLVDGRVVVEGGRLTVWDHEEVAAAAGDVVAAALAEAGLPVGPRSTWPIR